MSKLITKQTATTLSSNFRLKTPFNQHKAGGQNFLYKGIYYTSVDFYKIIRSLNKLKGA